MSLMDDVRTPINGHTLTPPPPNRRAEKRADQDAAARRRREDEDARAARKRQDAEAEAARRRAEQEAKADQQRKDDEAKQKAKQKAKKEHRAARAARLAAARDRLTHHMPLWGLPVVLASIVIGWAGQATAAAHLGMGAASIGIPLITEGMTLTFAGLTAAAIDNSRPHKGLLLATWAAAVTAATINAGGHLIEDSSQGGVYRAALYAAASLAALVLWAVTMRSRRASVSGKTAVEAARWRSIRRRHPVLYRRAQRLADRTGRPLSQTWPEAWERTHAAGPGEPSIREIRTARRAAYRRQVAEDWDGRTRLDRHRGTAPAASDAVTAPAAEAAPAAPGEAVPDGPSETVPAPALPVGLLVPDASGGWREHPVPVRPMGVPDAPRETATTRSPSGRDAFREGERDAPSGGSEKAAGDRVERVREMARDLVAKGESVTAKTLTVNAVRKRLSIRRQAASALQKTVLAEYGQEQER